MKIAVTGLNAIDSPGPGVPVIRSIKDAKDFKGEIIGLSYDSLDPGLYIEKLTSKSYLIPYPSSGLEYFLERLLAIHKIEKLDFIIPTLDSELYAFIKIQDKLLEAGIKLFLPTFEQLEIRSKDKLFNFCTKQGIKVPKNILATNISNLHSIQNNFSYPVVLKGIFYEAYIVNNFDEAVVAFNKLKQKWGFPIIVQEYIKGDEFNVVGLGDGTGKTIGAVVMRKLYITDKGKGWSGVTILDKTLLGVSNKFILTSKWKSGLELEFIKSAATGEYFLLEINPRFPAWVYLAPNAGQNLPWALVKLGMDEKVTSFSNYEIGKMFVRCAWDLITDMKVFEKISTTGELKL
ncbi:MAG: biotin carboxylase [Chlorobiaceae bacterium]|nr:biotin carboxylase [Chlorobiaceae bacterium]MBA4309527.1 biotin carboxylase [Chlorobiaceae bacterium]